MLFAVRIEGQWMFNIDSVSACTGNKKRNGKGSLPITLALLGP
jgi:hypothetical protein